MNLFAFCSGLGYNIDIPFIDDIVVDPFYKSGAWSLRWAFFICLNRV